MTLASSNEKNTGPTPGPWMIIPPGGPQGPFYGLVNQQGNVVATQIVGEADARVIATVPPMLDLLLHIVRYSDDDGLSNAALAILYEAGVVARPTSAKTGSGKP